MVNIKFCTPLFDTFAQNGREFRAYVAASPNNTWEYVGDDIFLKNTNRTLYGGIIDVSLNKGLVRL